MKATTAAEVVEDTSPTVVIIPHPSAPTPLGSGEPRQWVWPFAVVLGVVALVVRAVGLTRANDLFIDELTYAGLADQVAHGQLPSEAGRLFFLHPPASFVLNALVIRAFRLTGAPMDLVFELRWVNAVVGAASVVLVFLIARRLVGRSAAVVVAVVVAFDPFVLRNDSRVMIETLAMAAVLAGWLMMLVSLDHPWGRSRVWREVAAGLLFGLALVTKDMTFIPAVAPLLLALIWRRTLAWETVLRILPAACVPYLLYLSVLVSGGHLGAWFDEKMFGLRRMVGLEQVTGFNAVPHSGLLSRALELLNHFGTSYVLLGLCVVAGGLAAFSPMRVRRLIGLVALVTGAFGLYAVVGGAAEEQFGYYVVISSVLAVAAMFADLIDHRPTLRRAVFAVVAAFAIATVGLGVNARLAVDDGYLQARAWMDYLPSSTQVGLTNVTAEFGLLPHPGYGIWPSLSSLAENNADYVLTQSHPLSVGYGYASPELLSWLRLHGTPAFTFSGPSNGDTVVWRIDKRALASAVAHGLTLPPVTGGYR